ncbi:carbohydrate kinase [Aggregicoccus sp. 17bor-14]|uniref:PfkB family carbohydrate kinase n=1 Tax=Myxococcaceae TaxID=31 RepID=UPI00129C9A2D|nr:MULTISPECIES: PfkB family carbohydrate kinase [Myxococcaceae]MBF5042915.1 carbohydrate kinase [Simulacricoccus sp. 17bor-14]MRI88682.1 carbohydrate kinase [Aggregicoccus sp. 17bor-14]
MSAQVLLVGHYCHDRLQRAEGERHTLGGSAAYVSRVLAAAGVEHKVAGLVGEDFRYAHEVLHPAQVQGPHTTEFVARFDGEARTLTLGHVAPPVSAAQVRALGSAPLGLACGIAGEVLPEALEALLGACERVLVDAQALVRERGPAGEVRQRRLEGTAYAPLLARVHVLKASEEEAALLDLERLRARSCVVVTRGERGCTVLEGTAVHEVAAPRVQAVDPTGAGDCFLAGFALGLLRGLPPRACAELACRFGAQAVTQVGVPRLDAAAVQRLL